jgi:hypothetical protein
MKQTVIYKIGIDVFKQGIDMEGIWFTSSQFLKDKYRSVYNRGFHRQLCMSKILWIYYCIFSLPHFLLFCVVWPQTTFLFFFCGLFSYFVRQISWLHLVRKRYLLSYKIMFVVQLVSIQYNILFVHCIIVLRNMNFTSCSIFGIATVVFSYSTCLC